MMGSGSVVSLVIMLVVFCIPFYLICRLLIAVIRRLEKGK